MSNYVPLINPIKTEKSGWQITVEADRIHARTLDGEKLWDLAFGRGVYICEVRRDNHAPDLLSACESALTMLDTLFPADVFTGESGDPGAVLIAENRARLQAAIAKAKGE